MIRDHPYVTAQYLIVDYVLVPKWVLMEAYLAVPVRDLFSL